MGRRAVRWSWCVLAFCCLWACVGCRVEEEPSWSALAGGAVGGLAVVADGGDCLYGVDTLDFTLRAVLRGSGMRIRKVARGVDGSVLFTDEASALTPLLRRVGGGGGLEASVPLHSYAVAPYAHSGLVLVGRRRIEADGLAFVGLYDAVSLARRGGLHLHHGVRVAEDYCGWGDTICMAYVWAPHRSSFAYPVLLNTRTLDTAHCPIGRYLVDEQAEVFGAARWGDQLYLLTRTDQMLIEVHLPTRRVVNRHSLRHTLRSEYGLLGGSVYYLATDGNWLSMLYVWNGEGVRRVEWIRLDAGSLRVESVRRLVEDDGPWNDGDDLSEYGRFYLLVRRDGSRRAVLLVDKMSGQVAGRVDLPS